MQTSWRPPTSASPILGEEGVVLEEGVRAPSIDIDGPEGSLLREGAEEGGPGETFRASKIGGGFWTFSPTTFCDGRSLPRRSPDRSAVFSGSF